VVHECRHLILKLYKLEYQGKDEVATKINWLLEKDRFVCREKQREVSPVKVKSDTDKELTDVRISISGHAKS